MFKTKNKSSTTISEVNDDNVSKPLSKSEIKFQKKKVKRSKKRINKSSKSHKKGLSKHRFKDRMKAFVDFGINRGSSSFSFLKRTYFSFLKVLTDVLNGSNHAILNKQLFLAFGACLIMLLGFTISSQTYLSNKKNEVYDETIYSNNLEFSISKTKLEVDKIYQSNDKKTVFIPIVFNNGSMEKMPSLASEIDTDIQYGGSSIAGSQLKGSLYSYPGSGTTRLFIYAIKNSFDSFSNSSSKFTITVNKKLVDLDASESNSSTEDGKSTSSDESVSDVDTASFLVNLGSSKVVKLNSNDVDDILTDIYAKAVYNPLFEPLKKQSEESLDKLPTLYNQAESAASLLNSNKVIVPTTPLYASSKESGNVYNIDYKSNFVSGFFPSTSYKLLSVLKKSNSSSDTFKFNSGFPDTSNILYLDGTSVPNSDTSSTQALQNLTSTWSQITSIKQSVYYTNVLQIFDLQYGFNTGLSQRNFANNSYFTMH